VTASAAHMEPSSETVANWYSNYVRGHTDRLAVDLDLIKRLDPDRKARILDVGSTPPILLAALKAQGRTVRGVDIEPGRFQSAMDELGLDIKPCNIETERLPFDDGSFELVLLNEVFEHLRINPRRTCQELVRVLTTGGVLCVSTPNARSLRGIVNFVIRGRGGWCGAENIYAEYEKLDRLGHMGHVREYTLKDVRDFLIRFGLTFESVVWRGVDPGRVYRGMERFIPSLSPFMSFVLRKD
jgi:SAM-dependent methyltransferase